MHAWLTGLGYLHIAVCFFFVVSAAMDSDIGPVELVQFDSTNVTATLYEENLHKIFKSRPEIRELPTMVISVSGLARTGKSFLLNLLISYLTHLEQNSCDEGWESSDHVIKGMRWAQREKPVTSGIVMWGKPFIIDNRHLPSYNYQPNGCPQKMAVLLMDTQGTGDNSRAERLSTLIMYLSLQISTVQLFNVWRYITAENLAQLQLYAESEKMLLDSLGTNDSLSSSLVFVLRDYQAGGKYGEDTTHFSDLKESTMDHEMIESANAVENAFHSVSTFKFPYPGEVIASASCGVKNWSISDVGKSFILVAKSLFQKIIKPVWASDRKTYWATAVELYEQFKELNKTLEKQKLPIITSAESLREIIAYKAYNLSSLQLTKEVDMLERKVSEGSIESDQLRNCMTRIRSEVTKSFNSSSNSEKCSTTETWIKYYTILNEDFKSHFDRLLNTLEKEKHREDTRVQREITERLKDSIEKMKQKAEETVNQLDLTNRISRGKEQALRYQLDQLNSQIKRKKKRGIFGSLLGLIF